MTPDVPQTAQHEGASLLLAAMRRVLRPVARMMLAQNIGYRQASELLKQVYVDVARADLADEAAASSISRISLFTGINRKEVKRLRENETETIQIPKSVSQGALIIEAWTNSRRYLDADGRPLPLPRSADAPNEPNFDELIRSVTSDVHARTVLDEWLRLGLVFVGDLGRIHLVTPAFVAKHGLREKVFYFERNLHDHLAVAAANLEDHKDPLLERSVHYRGLPPAAIDELQALAQREGMKALQAVNRRALELRVFSDAEVSQSDEHGAVSNERMNFGLYFYRASIDRVVSPPIDSGAAND